MTAETSNPAAFSPPASDALDPIMALESLLASIGLTSDDTGGSVTFAGADPIFDSRLRLGAAIGIPVMAGAVAVAAIWRTRTGRGQDLHLDLRDAIHGIVPHYAWHPTLNGMRHAIATALDNFFLLAPYKTRDGRTVMASGVYPRMAANWLRFLDTPPAWDRIVAAIAQWDSAELEQAANARGLACTIARTPEEWLAHPQGALLARTPVIEIEQIGDSDPRPVAAGEQPLSGIRALSFTHAIAGPTIGRTLAEHGADVLGATFPNHLEHDFVYNEANVGSRSANLDLRIPAHRQRVEQLLASTDIVIDNHRPGKIARYGLGPEQLADRHPGIVTVSVSCYGHHGPWKDRAGYDMNGSAASGVMAIEGADGEPKLPPTGMLNDFITGYLGAAGATAALIRRANQGGSYHVKVSLTRTAMFAASLGTVDPALAGSSEHHQPLNPNSVTSHTCLGELVQLAPPARFSETTPRWAEPILVPRGSSTPEWHSTRASRRC
jgi:crotonobetainyl-CoA:carnitine CoA-transferase CaiB-like acyl-CoA transferase